MDIASLEEKIDLLRKEEEKYHSMKKKLDITKIILLILVLVVLVLLYHCNCPTSVKGYELDKYVEDQNGNPLVNATVILYNHPNGEEIARGETDEHGWCNFTDISYGYYYLWVAYGGVYEGEWIWLTEDKEMTNALTLPTEGWEVIK